MNHNDVLSRLDAVLAERKTAESTESYVASLYAQGDEGILSKIDEEAQEVIVAGRTDEKRHLVYEVADLWFHCMVMLAHKEIPVTEVLAELDARFGVSGHVEKRQRNKGN